MILLPVMPPEPLTDATGAPHSTQRTPLVGFTELSPANDPEPPAVTTPNSNSHTKAWQPHTVEVSQGGEGFPQL